MQSHLTNSENHGLQDLQARAGAGVGAGASAAGGGGGGGSLRANAEALKDQGNNKFRLQQVRLRLPSQTRAVSAESGARLQSRVSGSGACSWKETVPPQCALTSEQLRFLMPAVAAAARLPRPQFHDAIKLYSRAIATCPEQPTYYSNRAAALFMLQSYRQCIDDCKLALLRDPKVLSVVSNTRGVG
jgi:tetratricopeptide (TPR) repeat protein